MRDDYPAKPHDPPFGLYAAPALLTVLVVVIGLMPFLAEPLVTVAANAVTGYDTHPHLKLWHGVTPALYMSGVAFVVGAILLYLHGGLERIWNALPRPEAKVIFDRLIAAAVRLAQAVIFASHNGAMSRYLAVMVVVTIGLGYFAFATGGMLPPTREMLPVPPFVFVVWAGLLAAAMLIVTQHHNRFRALVFIAVIGLGISIGFVYLSAPDLALTQISVETVTILLLLLALYFLPKETPRESSTARKLRDATISIAAGVAVAALAMMFLTRDFSSISAYHLANSYKGGGGTNVVNVILVDFRGYDTYGEIIVLGIAGLMIYAMMDALLRGPAAKRLRDRDFAPDRSRDRHPLMMVVATRALLPIAMMVGIYFFLRGHNQPGGGFIAGLVVSIALLMQYMASGFAWAQMRQRMEYHTLIGWGVLIAGLTGVGAWLAGKPFLTSAYGYLHFPPIEEFEWATAMAFDLGVFLAVLGAVMLMLYSLSRIARFAGETVNIEPMDYDPSAEDVEEDASG